MTINFSEIQRIITDIILWLYEIVIPVVYPFIFFKKIDFIYSHYIIVFVFSGTNRTLLCDIQHTCMFILQHGSHYPAVSDATMLLTLLPGLPDPTRSWADGEMLLCPCNRLTQSSAMRKGKRPYPCRLPRLQLGTGRSFNSE